MPNFTPNYNLKKPLQTENYNIDDVNGNMDIVDNQIKLTRDSVDNHIKDNAKQIPHLGTTTNIANAFSITTTEIILANQKFTAKINIATTGASTLSVSTVGTAKPIKKTGGLDVNLKIGVYTFFYDGTVFQLLGEGGEYGTATEDDVVLGKTIGTDNGIVIGTGANAKRKSNGTISLVATTGQNNIVSNLTFAPSKVIITYTNASNENQYIVLSSNADIKRNNSNVYGIRCTEGGISTVSILDSSYGGQVTSNGFKFYSSYAGSASYFAYE